MLDVDVDVVCGIAAWEEIRLLVVSEGAYKALACLQPSTFRATCATSAICFSSLPYLCGMQHRVSIGL
jgi:hypothetical protein